MWIAKVPKVDQKEPVVFGVSSCMLYIAQEFYFVKVITHGLFHWRFAIRLTRNLSADYADYADFKYFSKINLRKSVQSADNALSCLPV